jgi:hypothetical protein
MPCRHEIPELCIQTGISVPSVTTKEESELVGTCIKQELISFTFVKLSKQMAFAHQKQLVPVEWGLASCSQS